MANLTDRQRKLLNLLNQMSQNMVTTNNTNNDSTLSHNFSLNLPGFSLGGGQNLNLSLGKWGGGGTPSTPTTIREVLLSLVNEQVQVTTPFDTISGTLLSVQDDYVVIIEASGAQVLVRIEKIEFVSNT